MSEPGRDRRLLVEHEAAGEGIEPGLLRGLDLIGGTGEAHRADEDRQVGVLGGPAAPRRLGLHVAELGPVDRTHLELLATFDAAVPTDPRRLEFAQVLMADPKVGAARDLLADPRRQRRVDDVDAVSGVGHPQRDPQVGVRPDRRRDHAARALGGENQVNPERASAAGQVDQPFDEGRQFLCQRGELVDHEGEAGQGLRSGAVVEVPVVLDVLGASALEQAFPAPQLCRQRRQRPLGQVPVEVGHHAHGVRELGAVLEGAAALVVDEHEAHGVGAVGDREAGDQGLEELALARAGRPRNQAVRPVRPQVDGHGSGDLTPDDGLRRPPVVPPALDDPFRVGILEPQEVQESQRRRQQGDRLGPAAEADRCQGPGQRLGPRGRDAVGQHRRGLGSPAHPQVKTGRLGGREDGRGLTLLR